MMSKLSTHLENCDWFGTHAKNDIPLGHVEKLNTAQLFMELRVTTFLFEDFLGSAIVISYAADGVDLDQESSIKTQSRYPLCLIGLQQFRNRYPGDTRAFRQFSSDTREKGKVMASSSYSSQPVMTIDSQIYLLRAKLAYEQWKHLD
jgi:hypothetical protein